MMSALTSGMNECKHEHDWVWAGAHVGVSVWVCEWKHGRMYVVAEKRCVCVCVCVCERDGGFVCVRRHA